MHVKGFEPEFIEQVYTCINSSLSAFQKHVGLKGRLTIREKVPNRIICSFSYIHHKTTKSNIYIYIYTILKDEVQLGSHRIKSYFRLSSLKMLSYAL